MANGAGLILEALAWRNDAETFVGRSSTTLRIINALILREIMTRFGRENLGFLWLVLEPLVLTIIVMIGWTIMYGSTKHGVTVIQIVLSGYSMLTLWRHFVSRFMHSFRHNAGLMFHRNVKPLDTLVARAVLESLGCILSFFVSFFALYLLDMIDPIADVLTMLCAWFLLCAFSFSVAVLVAALCELWEHTEKFVQPFMYVTIPLTGAFSMLSWFPTDYHQLLLYSPMLNTVEMFRAGLIGGDVQTYYDPIYVLEVSLVLTAAGLIMLKKAEGHLRLE